MNDLNSLICPGFFISALKGGSGKTIITIGIIASLKKKGISVAPFKKGPDYIDAGWLHLAAGNPCYNLDTYLIPENKVIYSYLKNSKFSNKDIAVIEGNRGLFDGTDIYGKTSTAETAKLLNSPVFLVLDCTKSTRTMAASVLGCLKFDEELNLGGVILNRVAGPRHKNNLINNIEYHTGVEVIGSVPKLRTHDFPERHMGLVPTFEHEWAVNSVNKASEIVNDNINIKNLIEITERTYKGPDKKIDFEFYKIKKKSKKTSKPVIGIIRDSAFQFYYPENIESLIDNGAEIVNINSLEESDFPDIDALYIGGGFPETHAEKLAANNSLKVILKNKIENFLPVYAECGGLIFLGESIKLEDKKYEMAGIFPIEFSISRKPEGHGYVEAEVENENPYFNVGDLIRGHEFRYSKIENWKKGNWETAFKMKRGTGMQNKVDGIFYKKVFATYVHIHASGTPGWAKKMVENAKKYRENKLRS